MTGSETALAYHEPTITTIITQAGFLLVLNVVNVCLDRLVYCGLIGQLFIGMLWGTPGAKWLDRDLETAIQQLGYLGLIMLVYEGGLSTSLPSLKANVLLSLMVAITGIGVPMGLSFVLGELVSATPLQAFSAGAALSATSLGTTFAILSTTGLIKTRLGTVTTGAAMLDDVVGLVMVQIITNLGASSGSFSATTVVRPVFVSIGFAVGVLLGCRFLVTPVLRVIIANKTRLPKPMHTVQFHFLLYTCLLVVMVAGATYAGTSSLFASYLAGVVTSWIDGFSKDSESVKHTVRQVTHAPMGEGSGEESNVSEQDQADHAQNPPTSASQDSLSGMVIYERYYRQPVARILTPLFFASIGFAIPITEMFDGKIIWRGVVYAVLMAFGKLVTGLWLVRFPVTSYVRILIKPFAQMAAFCTQPRVKSKNIDQARKKKKETRSQTPQGQSSTHNQTETSDIPRFSSQEKLSQTLTQTSNQIHTTMTHKPKSLYPASILGLAMISRGEIGYLIASLAESKGIFGASPRGESSEVYLVVVWAISLCTLVGPICVGSLVRRVKSLQRGRQDVGGEDPLGVWGI
ncbi:Sodium/hydrogen exchanger family-domain-containing protein [Aspergillus avenaceus]|uniref:Sodium/hydrogen exchanger family-domain-containing protein n=1 Tax=Aspergillus avenaceus TaxID=36643 RepID=A0A5N6TZF4_ASPAV|nr:Sodium/hydrogen exchanger family-domain-containing protein [Aspergillus avenaceus]